MAKQSLDHRTVVELQPMHGLWKLYDPSAAELAFKARSHPAALAWQKKAAAALADVVGFQSGPVVTARPKLLESVDKGDYVRQKVLLRTGPATVMPVYLLIPKGGRTPRAAVIAFHGHGYGVKDIVGLWEDGADRVCTDGYHKDFAVALCRRGFLVAAPEISCFGERVSDFSYLAKLGSPVPRTCDHTANLATFLGGTALGMRVWEGRCLVDYLAARKDVDPGRIGAMGISGGGMHTFFSTCLDRRIKACVVSGYFCTFRHSILAMLHCQCNFVPGLHRFGEIYDLAGLIAPRPMLVEAASRDNIFPLHAVKHAVAKARQVYRVFDADGAIQTDFFEGRHEISGAKAYDFLALHLGA